jgi:PAS domain S-box-containing protein
MALPLVVASGAKVGDLIVLYDISALKSAQNRLMAVAAGGALVLLAGLFGFLFVLLRRTDRGIRAQQAQLRESEQSYRNQYTANSSVMLLVDPKDGVILDANAAAVSFYGFSRERLLAMRITDINSMSAPETRQAMASVPLEQGTLFQRQHRLANGSVRDVEASISSIQFGGRTVLHAIINDVTERKRAERYQNLSAEILGALNEPLSMREVADRILAAIQRETGFDAVGIRLRRGEDFPYFVQSGF